MKKHKIISTLIGFTIIAIAVIILFVGVFIYQHFILKTIGNIIKFQLKEQIPTEIGQCIKTKVSEIGTRLKNTPNSGSWIAYANGIQQVSYHAVKGIEDSRPGDEINLCLSSIPTDCPPGDDRGKGYRATNLRNGESWDEGDSEHLCGGA